MAASRHPHAVCDVAALAEYPLFFHLLSRPGNRRLWKARTRTKETHSWDNSP
jgi:hypothetical protein